jgi:hypothetical protein
MTRRPPVPRPTCRRRHSTSRRTRTVVTSSPLSRGLRGSAASCSAADSLIRCRGLTPGGFNATHFEEPRAERGWDSFPHLLMDTTKQEANPAPAAFLCSPAGKSDSLETVCRMSRLLCKAWSRHPRAHEHMTRWRNLTSIAVDSCSAETHAHELWTWTPGPSACLLRPARQPAHRHSLCKAPLHSRRRRPGRPGHLVTDTSRTLSIDPHPYALLRRTPCSVK